MAWPCCSWDTIWLTVLFRLLMPVTVLICAIWDVICELSTGLSGSWLLIWATSSFRKVSDRFCALVPVAVEPVPVVLVAPVVAGSWNRFDRFVLELTVIGDYSSGAQLQNLLQQAFGRVHHVHVGLVAARGRDHVDHLLDRIDIRHRHHPVRIG